MTKLELRAQKKEEQHAARAYWWLFWSAFITVPWIFFGMPHAQTTSFENSEPAWSPNGRSIAYVSDRDGNKEIHVMNVDGTANTRNITQNPATDYDPAWSPDGRSIAFSSNRGEGNFEIYVANSDGTNLRRITRSPGNDENPSWSPDGKFIAFYSGRDGNREIYVMNADGTNARNLTNNAKDDWPPAWSPDGKFIAFSSLRDGNWEIYVMNADGSNPRNLTNNRAEDRWPSWSPDGKFIAFDSTRDGKRDIYVMNVDGTNPRNISNNRADDFDPSWSPDGQQIAFESDRNAGHNIYVLNKDGSGVRRLTDSSKTIEPPTSGYISATITPALINLVLLLGLLSSNLFVRRHTQQALGLLALNLISTVVFMGLMRGEGVWFWVITNGSLWLFGTIWGTRQVDRGESWMMRWRGESAQLPRPWAVMSPETAEPIAPPSPVAQKISREPNEALEAGKRLVLSNRNAAIQYFVQAFRNGTPELRRQAAAELEKLGEVEIF